MLTLSKELKCLIIGAAESGKTQYANQLNPQGKFKTEYKATVGMQTHCIEEARENEKLSLLFRDTGCPNEYSMFIGLSSKNVHSFIVCINPHADVAGQIALACSYLPDFKKYNSGKLPPFSVAITKADLYKSDEERKTAFTTIKQQLQTSELQRCQSLELTSAKENCYYGPDGKKTATRLKINAKGGRSLAEFCAVNKHTDNPPALQQEENTPATSSQEKTDLSVAFVQNTVNSLKLEEKNELQPPDSQEEKDKLETADDLLNSKKSLEESSQSTDLTEKPKDPEINLNTNENQTLQKTSKSSGTTSATQKTDNPLNSKEKREENPQPITAATLQEWKTSYLQAGGNRYTAHKIFMDPKSPSKYRDSESIKMLLRFRANKRPRGASQSILVNSMEESTPTNFSASNSQSSQTITQPLSTQALCLTYARNGGSFARAQELFLNQEGSVKNVNSAIEALQKREKRFFKLPFFSGASDKTLQAFDKSSRKNRT